MNKRNWSGKPVLAVVLCLFSYGCSSGNLNNIPAKTTISPDEKSLTAGSATSPDQSREAFSHFSPKLSFAEKTSFFAGESFFDQNWIIAPSSTEARDGLGPFFNARSCASCHFKDGRGRPPKEGEEMESLLIRVSIPGKGEFNEPLPSHGYGDQIQGFSVPELKPEAEVKINYQEIKDKFSDGETYILNKPVYQLINPNYGEPEKELLLSPRVAAQMIGMGLLEDISEKDILALADPDDLDKNGISGKPNYVRDVENKKTVLGRLGWKANQPSVRQQVAGAFSGDLGITSNVFPIDNYSMPEQQLFNNLKLINGGSPEISSKNLDKVVFYSRNLAVPARRNTGNPEVLAGERLFSQLSCNKCHTNSFQSQNETIHPYTDLLLHNMGADLADNRPDFLADGNEWRTPPLWGIGLFKIVNGHTNYLHDGRANNLSEAVLWHGGEAGSARDEFKKLNKTERNSLIKFLESL